VFSHDGEIVASSSDDGTVRLWRVATGESLATITAEKNSDVYKLNWTSDDRRLAITYWGKKFMDLTLWDVPTQRAIIHRRFQDTYFVECSPDGRTFLTLDGELKLHVWDVTSGQATQTLTPALVATEPYTISFVANGQRILTATSGKPTQLWDVASGELIDTYPPNTPIPNTNYQRDVSVVSLDKRFLLSDSVKIYETESGRLRTSITDGSNPISLSPDGQTVLTVSYNPGGNLRHRQSYLTSRKLDHGAELIPFQVPEGIHEIVWSPDGKKLAIVGLSFHTRVIDALTGREYGRLPYGNCWPWTMCGSDGCEPIKFSADGAMLLKEKEPIKLWDTQTVSLITILKAAHLPAVFSPTDGQLLATRSKDKKSVLLWRLKR
jgi:WD40 repeat protein